MLSYQVVFYSGGYQSLACLSELDTGGIGALLYPVPLRVRLTTEGTFRGHCYCFRCLGESLESVPMVCPVPNDPYRAAPLGYIRKSVGSPEVDYVTVGAVL